MRDADANPAAVREHIETVLGFTQLPPRAILDDATATTAWALGLALRHLRILDDSAEWLRAARQFFDEGTADHAQVTLTLAGTLAFAGDLSDADDILASTVAPDELAGRFAYQRAAIAEHRGDVRTAEVGYHRALEQFRESADELGEAHASGGLGLIGLNKNRAAEALVRFGLARALFARLELPMLAASAQNNMGLAATRAGDLLTAIDQLEEAANEYAVLGEPYCETALDRAEALLLLGRTDDATTLTKVALETLGSSPEATDRPELLIGLGRALVAAGEAKLAARAFDTAERLFQAQERHGWIAVVELRRMEAASHAPDMQRLADIAERLQGHGFGRAAADADVHVVTQSDLDSTDPAVDGALGRLRQLPADDNRRAIAECFSFSRQRRYGDACDVASRALQRCSTSIGRETNLELRTALLAQRDHIVRQALRAAHTADEPELALEIVAQVHRIALQPPGARRLHGAIDEAVAAARSSDVSVATWRSLVASVEDRADPPPLDEVAQSRPRVRYEDLAARSIVAVIDDGEHVWSIDFDDRGASFLPMPDRVSIVGAIRRHEAVLQHAVVDADGLHDAMLETSAELVRSMLPWLRRDDRLSIAATGAMASAPWSSLATAPVRLLVDFAQSAPIGRGVTVVSGPNLASRDAEMTAIREAVPEAKVARGYEEALRRSAGQILHLTCHGHHDRRNPLLSWYELDGGSLTGEDIGKITDPPSLVVAAACRSARTEARGDFQAIGLPTAWIASGTSSVVAPAIPIPDDERTAQVMGYVHRQLQRDPDPAAAVHAARTADPHVARALTVVSRL